MEQQEITVYAAITISSPLVYHLIRWNVPFPVSTGCLDDVPSLNQQRNKLNNTNGLAFYHEIRWNVEIPDELVCLVCYSASNFAGYASSVLLIFD
jgi:hypothetical protein